MNSDRDFDALLDSALRDYSGEAPLGLESRVLRAVQESRRPVRWWWLMVPAFGVAGLALVSLVPAPRIDAPLPDGHGSDAAPPAIAYQMSRLPSKPTLTRRLSPQQRAMLEFATKHPEQAASLMPVLPAEITIEPLTITELD
jgi:hypothetical protein